MPAPNSGRSARGEAAFDSPWIRFRVEIAPFRTDLARFWRGFGAENV
jgi:hypothetical protein